MPDTMMKIDLHCHTEASLDCSTPLEEIPARCLQRGIAVQAITDHNEIWGALKLKAIVEERGLDLDIIVGEEVLTNQGEIIGLFLYEKIPPLLTPEETVRRIRKQGGLVLLPHGFDPYKAKRLRPAARERIADEIDIVETFNTHISRPHYNSVAFKWAQEHGKPISAGSDAHRLQAIGSAWVEAPARSIQHPDQLMATLIDVSPTGAWTSPLVTAYHDAVDRIARLVGLR